MALELQFSVLMKTTFITGGFSLIFVLLASLQPATAFEVPGIYMPAYLREYYVCRLQVEEAFDKCTGGRTYLDPDLTGFDVEEILLCYEIRDSRLAACNEAFLTPPEPNRRYYYHDDQGFE